MLVSRAGARSRRAAGGIHALAALAVGVMVLAGCQSNPEPPPLESASGSPSPAASESPTPAAPTLPAEARGTSEAAAKAFVRHWIDVLNYAGSSGDTRRLRDLSSNACESCDSIIRRIEEVYGSNGWIDGRGWSVFSLNAVRGQPADAPILETGVRLSAQRIKPGVGDEVQQFKGGVQPMIFRLRYSDGWKVAQLEKVE